MLSDVHKLYIHNTLRINMAVDNKEEKNSMVV